MKTIIAGSRVITDIQFVRAAVAACPWRITEVVSGAARGVDTLGEQVAQELSIPVVIFPADWQGKGRAAGPIRNQQMAEYAAALLAVWDGQSRGTLDMVKRATRHKLLVHVVNINQQSLPDWSALDEFTP